MYNRDENPAALHGSDILGQDDLRSLSGPRLPKLERIKTARELRLELVAQLAVDLIAICATGIKELHPNSPKSEEVAIKLTDCRSKIIRVLESK